MPESTIEKFLKIANQLLGKDKIRTVIEVGARDCEETLAFKSHLKNATIFTFECNPATLPICRQKVKDKKDIFLIEKAVSNTNGTVRFFPIDPSKTQTTWPDGNPGASSLLKASGKYSVEVYVQNEIEVEAIKLSTFTEENNLKTIDLLWMDIQGAELMALQGLDDRLKDVKIIHTEVEFFEIYQNQPQFKDIKEYLENNGFVFWDFTSNEKYAADAVFVNKLLLKNSPHFLTLFFYKKIIGTFKRYLPFSFLSKLLGLIRSSYRWCVYPERKNFLLTFRRSLYFLRYILLPKLLEKANWSVISQDRSYSTTKLNILYFVIERDLFVFLKSIELIKKNIAHPIGKIIVVAPDSEQIKKACTENNLTFISENSIIPLKKSDITTVIDGIDRTGWIFKQLLILHADLICEQEHFLVLDADTILIKPQVFESKGKYNLRFSDEYHIPYFDFIDRLFAGKIRKLPVSLIAHHMLFDKTKLKALRKEVEQIHQTGFIQAVLNNIDFNEISCISEYELYGNFVSTRYKNQFKHSYWWNLTLPQKEISKIDNIEKENLSKYRSISFHHYNS